MASPVRRTTVSIDAKLHRGLRAKARKIDRSIGDLVAEAVKRSLAEDADDLSAFERRAHEHSHDFTQVVRRLRRSGRL